MRTASKKSDKAKLLPNAAAGKRFGIAVSGFHRAIGETLLAGAKRALLAHGAEDEAVEVFWVPGSFELPLALKKLAESRRFDALVALGLVVRGETPHFEYVAGEASRGIAKVAYDFGLPVGFGLLTTLNVGQALERAGGREGNKGEDAALAVLQMLDVIQRV